MWSQLSNTYLYSEGGTKHTIYVVENVAISFTVAKSLSQKIRRKILWFGCLMYLKNVKNILTYGALEYNVTCTC